MATKLDKVRQEAKEKAARELDRKLAARAVQFEMCRIGGVKR